MIELTDQDHEQARRWIKLISSILGIGDQLADLETVEPTDCDDCTRDGNDETATYRYGSVTICARCAKSRLKVAAKLAKDALDEEDNIDFDRKPEPALAGATASDDIDFG